VSNRVRVLIYAATIVLLLLAVMVDVPTGNIAKGITSIFGPTVADIVFRATLVVSAAALAFFLWLDKGSYDRLERHVTKKWIEPVQDKRGKN
jgi:hypothetical protein